MKNIVNMFLTATLALVVLISPIGISTATAATVTDQDISNQRSIATDSSRDAVQQYIRLLLYMIIQRLETEVDAQTGK